MSDLHQILIVLVNDGMYFYIVHSNSMLCFRSPLNTSLDQMFPIGKVVQCKVIYADVTNQKMTVSTKVCVRSCVFAIFL